MQKYEALGINVFEEPSSTSVITI